MRFIVSFPPSPKKLTLQSRVFAFAVLAAGMALGPAQAQTFTYNNGGATGVWSLPANWSGNAAYPDAAGVVATMNTGAGFSTELDVNATVGALRNTAGSARVWAITNSGGFALALDGTGLTNGFGNLNTAEIRATASGGIVSAANLILSNTNVDIGTTGSNNSAAQITLTGTITAATNQTITVRNNRRQTNLQGDIGASGAGGITIVNLSSSATGIGDPNQLNISGNLGSQVVQVTQGAGTTTGMVISGANSAFSGSVSVLANSITVTSTGTLGNFNTINVADSASLILQNAGALGFSSSLQLTSLAAVSLSYSGTMSIGMLSLDGGSTFAAAGTWGAVGSGATFESTQFSGVGLLNVTAVPEPTSWSLLLGAGMILIILRRCVKRRIS
jgi:hypothetical protein